MDRYFPHAMRKDVPLISPEVRAKLELARIARLATFRFSEGILPILKSNTNVL